MTYVTRAIVTSHQVVQKIALFPLLSINSTQILSLDLIFSIPKSSTLDSNVFHRTQLSQISKHNTDLINMPACTTCKAQNAVLKCSGCSAYQPPNSINYYYCNKACQKQDWSEHKDECRLARIYARVRHIDHPDRRTREEHIEFNATRPDFDKLSIQIAVDFAVYMKAVPPPARPEFLNSGSVIQPILMTGIKEQYIKNWEKRVPKHLRDLCYTENEYQVPYNCRPVKDIPDAGGAQSKVIESFPQDFEVLSFSNFRTMFGGQARYATDPWKQMPTDPERFARGQPQTSMEDDGDEQWEDVDDDYGEVDVEQVREALRRIRWEEKNAWKRGW